MTSPAPISEHGPQGLVWAYRFLDDGCAERIDDAAVGAALRQPEGWLWLHLNLSDQRACNWIKLDAPIPALARTVLLSSDEHQRLEVLDGTVIGVLADLHYEPERDSSSFGRLRFSMSERLIVSARSHALRSIESTRRRIDEGARFVTAIELLEGVVDQFARTTAAMTASMIDTLDAIEDQVLDDVPHDERSRLGPLRRQAVRMHRQVAPLKALFAGLADGASDRMPVSIARVAARLAQRLDSLGHDMEAIQERARLLNEQIAAEQTEQTNRHLYMLSVITSLLLPPTLVVGIFGMNTGGLPLANADQGSFWAAGIAVGSSALAYYLMARLGVTHRNSRSMPPSTPGQR